MFDDQRSSPDISFSRSCQKPLISVHLFESLHGSASLLVPLPDRNDIKHTCLVLWLTHIAQFEYRFTKCGGLCLGLFTSVDTSDSSAPLASVETASSAHFVYSGAPARKSVLLAHCVVTKTTNPTVMDEDMEVPDDWKASGASSAKIGHREEGRTIAVHSLAVLPSLQNQGLGSTLLKAFIQRMEYVQAADRIALLAHGELVKFYEKLGFENKGPSKATFGGGNWVDMVLELKNNQK
ncbi:polyamine acetyltransferase, variant, partial [Aureobasidium melanogenum]